MANKKLKVEKGSNISTSPHVIQRASKLVLSGKCPLNRPTYLKLRRHRNILRKLASLKGSTRCKKGFITKHKKQVGGLLPLLLPLVGSVIAGAASRFLKR